MKRACGTLVRSPSFCRFSLLPAAPRVEIIGKFGVSERARRFDSKFEILGPGQSLGSAWTFDTQKRASKNEGMEAARNTPFPSYEIDSKRIETLAQKHAGVDIAFARYLKTQDSRHVDQIVQKIASEVTAAIDCTACAKCCRALVIAPDYKDVSRLAEHTSLTTHEFRKKYMRLDAEGDVVMRQRPCPFLKSSRCSVYEARPNLCRKYPYLDQPNFVDEINRVLRNVHVCPIVFNTYERLKSEYQEPRVSRAAFAHR